MNLSKIRANGAIGRLGLRLAVASFICFGTTVIAARSAEDQAKGGTGPALASGRIVVDVQSTSVPTPLFFSTTAEQTIQVGLTAITGEAKVKVHVLQGRPEVVTLGFSGEGEVVAVTGKRLRDWSVRQTAGKRFLDLRTTLSSPPPDPQDLELTIQTRIRKPATPGSMSLLMITAGDSTAFSSKLVVRADPAIDLRVVSVAGLVPLDEGDGVRGLHAFLLTGEGRIEVKVNHRGALAADAELLGAQLSGKVNEAAGSVDFRLKGQFRVSTAGARLKLLFGRAALIDKTIGEGWRVELVGTEGGRFAYELVSEREGTWTIDLPFAAQIQEAGDWRQLDFAMVGGAVVPMQLEGLGKDVSFKPDAPIVPTLVGEVWRGFLPADGAAALGWKRTRVTSEGALFFTSDEQSDVRVGAGLLRQTTQLALRVLQGKLSTLSFRVEGAGEIVGVEGTHVTGWKVSSDGPVRRLEVRLSRPVDTEGNLTIRSQAELGTYPVRAEPIRLIPEGVVRHSGFVRVANDGAVRLEVGEVMGMMQLAPTQFPGPAVEHGVRQIFVYRFPSAEHGYRVMANQIQAEVTVSELATYELGETDRVINASIELDVREAPLREWSLQIPADYTVAGVTGGEVSDYVAETAVVNGYRALKILFSRAIDGRQLLQLRLEKNQSAAAGNWGLRPLQFPGARSVRGYIGVTATPGFRIVPAQVERLLEVPLTYFPKQMAGLQQAWRIRESDWAAAMRVEALGQSVQADVFHLYSIKEGIVYGSVLVNYFVVGAPATEWRLEVPPEMGNIDVVGQNVRRDWRREGNQVIVSLHQSVLGAATLLLTFEQPMSARGGTIMPGQVRPLGVQVERGFIEVVSPLQVKHATRRAEGGLLKLEPSELPAEFRVLTGAPPLAVYQYTARPFNLELDLEWYAAGETVDQVVDFAKLSSQISRDGQVVTDANYFVKTKGRQALRFTLPQGMKLWEARVDNEVATARVDGEQLLIPLPARLNPNEPVAVALRFGQNAGDSPSVVTLAAPRTTSPVVISEWILHGDTGRVLVPKKGNADVAEPPLTETGFEWISDRARLAAILLLAVVGGSAFLARSDSALKGFLGLTLAVAALGLTLILTMDSVLKSRVTLHELSYTSTLVPVEESVTLQVANLSEWRSLFVAWGLVAAVVGGALLMVSAYRTQKANRLAAQRGQVAIPVGLDRVLPVMGAATLAAGLLAQHGGAIPFFAVVALAIYFCILVPGFVRWNHLRRAQSPQPPEAPHGGAQTVVPLLFIAGLFVVGLATAPKLRAETKTPTSWLPEGMKPMQSIAQTWSIRDDRLFAEVELTVRGMQGESFLFLRPPAVLTDFKGEGVRVGKVEQDGQTAYTVAPEKDGVFTAHARFEMPLVDRSRGLALPTGPAAAQRVSIELDQGGWEFTSKAAMQILPRLGLGEGRSGATLVLAPLAEPVIHFQPKTRNLAEEKTQFFVEAANLYVPGPGVVTGYARFTIRPVQGRVTELDLDVPKGLTVVEVARGPVGSWRFDPEKRRLHLAIEPAQSEAFRFDVETQFGTGVLPFDVSLEPLRVAGAVGEVGTIALAFGGEAQPEGTKSEGLSTVNLQDFDPSLLPRNRAGQPLAVLQQVWRYGQAAGHVNLRIAAVAPEVRVASRQILSLDDERLVMAVDLNVSILRVGLFKLSFVLPEGLEIEAASGAALNQWTEAKEKDQRVITLQLNGRTIGDQTFALTLAGSAPRAQAAWTVPKLLVREATRQTGEALIVPGKGLRLRGVERVDVTQLDPRSVGGMQPGTLAFRLLQESWQVRLGIEALEPWVTVLALQEMTVREGQTLTRLGLRYRVENAAVKQFRVKLPGLGEEQARTVQATGSAVSDMVRVDGVPELWEIRLKRGIVGETEVQIEYQGPTASAQNQEKITPPEFPGARQTTQFVAVRGGGRLELEAGALPRGWTKMDWGAVPATIQNRGDRTVPALCFRVAEPEAALSIVVRRHDVAEALKLRVTQAHLTTLFSAQGASLTAVELKVEVLEKSTLQVMLPSGARLFNTFVNGESVSVVREGAAFLFHVAPNSDADRSAAVRMVYSAAGAGKSPVALTGPRLSVPLENVTWRVVVPPGYEINHYSGGLRLREERVANSFGIDDYQSLVVSKRTEESKNAVALLERANVLLQHGDQQKAGEVLSRAFNTYGLDEASNEDARVQLRNLKTQQTVVGLNTRRQRLYLDNRVDAARNEQLEQAANLNPLIQGKLNFDPQQLDQLMMGNTVEENTALRGIATRLVDQQLVAEPAPSAIDVTLPERGRVFTFDRSLQVDGAAPLLLTLDLGKTAYTGVGFSVLLLIGIAVVGASLSLKAKG